MAHSGDPAMSIVHLIHIHHMPSYAQRSSSPGARYGGSTLGERIPLCCGKLRAAGRIVRPMKSEYGCSSCVTASTRAAE